MKLKHEDVVEKAGRGKDGEKKAGRVKDGAYCLMPRSWSRKLHGYLSQDKSHIGDMDQPGKVRGSSDGQTSGAFRGL